MQQLYLGYGDHICCTLGEMKTEKCKMWKKEGDVEWAHRSANNDQQAFLVSHDPEEFPRVKHLKSELTFKNKCSLQIDGVQTEGENIADNGGIREAFRAYQLYVDRNGEEPRLPGLDEFSPNHLFYLGFANVSTVA